MTNKNQISEEEKRAIVNYLSGEPTHSDHEILSNWLSKSEENKRFLDQLSDVWVTTGYYHCESVDADAVWNEIRQQTGSSRRNNGIFTIHAMAKYAAVFVVAMFLGALGYYFISSKQIEQSESALFENISPLGARSFIKMSDGSKIWLNAGTTLKYRKSYGTSNRELYLSGEAFFNVEKNTDLPFVVKTSEIDVIALGTRFNVKAYAEEETIETTLIEGSVKLVASMGKLADNIILKPNEKAVYTRINKSAEPAVLQLSTPDPNKNAKLQIIESIEPAPVISWKNKRWIIQNEKLGDLAVKLERRFNVNFVFENEELKQYSFGGTLEDESLEQIMEAIGFSSPIKFSIDKNTVYIMEDDQKIEKYKNLIKKK